jgi:hypothetical protein
VLLLSIPFLLLAGAGGVVFWVLGADFLSIYIYLLTGQCHEMDIFSEGLNIFFTFCVCADGFKVFQKLSTTLYKY